MAALTLIFLAAIAWFVYRLYREQQLTLATLTDPQKAGLFGAVGAIALLVVAYDEFSSWSGGRAALDRPDGRLRRGDLPDLAQRQRPTERRPHQTPFGADSSLSTRSRHEAAPSFGAMAPLAHQPELGPGIGRVRRGASGPGGLPDPRRAGRGRRLGPVVRRGSPRARARGPRRSAETPRPRPGARCPRPSDGSAVIRSDDGVRVRVRVPALVPGVELPVRCRLLDARCAGRLTEPRPPGRPRSSWSRRCRRSPSPPSWPLQLLLVGYSLTIADGAAEAGALAGASGRDASGRRPRRAARLGARPIGGERRGRPGAGRAATAGSAAGALRRARGQLRGLVAAAARERR